MAPKKRSDVQEQQIEVQDRELVLGTGYNMSNWVEHHKQSGISVHLGQNVCLYKGLEDGLLCCVIESYDPRACLEFWDNIRWSESDEYKFYTKVKGKAITVNQALLRKVFGFETFGPENNGDPTHTWDEQKKFIVKIRVDPSVQPRLGLKVECFQKEYADLGGYFARALWAHTSGNDNMSARKLNILMIIDEAKNFDWGKYLTSLFKLYKDDKKLPLTYQIQKILDHEKIVCDKSKKVETRKYKKPSKLPSVRALFTAEVIEGMRQAQKALFAEQIPRVEDASTSSVRQTDISTEEVADEDQANTFTDDDVLINEYVSLKKRKKTKVAPGILLDEDIEMEDIPHGEDTTMAGGSSVHLDSDVFRPIDETAVAGDDSLDLARWIGEQSVQEIEKQTPACVFKRQKQVASKPKTVKETMRKLRSDLGMSTETIEQSTETFGPHTANVEQPQEDTHADNKEEMLTKKCRRRLEDLIDYKLSHRSKTPNYQMAKFEDWVCNTLSYLKLSLHSIYPIPQNKKIIREMIMNMKIFIVEKESQGQTDISEMMYPSDPVSDLDASDDEFEKETEAEAKGETMPIGGALQAKLDSILSKLNEVEKSVSKTPTVADSGVSELVKSIEKQVADRLKGFGIGLDKFQDIIYSYVTDLGHEYDLGALLVDHFVAAANKGDMVANTPAARKNLREKLLARRKMKEATLRQPGIGRLTLTDELKEEFLIKKEDIYQWSKYKHLSFEKGLELFLQELYIDYRVKLWRKENQAKPLMTFYDHVDEFMAMYLADTFGTEFGWSYPIEEAWRLFLMVTPKGMDYLDKHRSWMKVFAEEMEQYKKMSIIDKDIFAAKRMSETVDQKRQRIEEMIKTGDIGTSTS